MSCIYYTILSIIYSYIQLIVRFRSILNLYSPLYCTYLDSFFFGIEESIVVGMSIYHYNDDDSDDDDDYKTQSDPPGWIVN